MENKDQKQYEISFLAVSEKGKDEILKTLQKFQGAVSFESPAGRLNLSYQIKRQKSAFFGYFHFSALTEAIKKISEDLKLNAEILRFLIITPPIAKQAPMSQRARMRIRRVALPKEAKEELKKAEIVKSEIKSVLTNEELEKKLEEILK